MATVAGLLIFIGILLLIGVLLWSVVWTPKKA